MAADEKAARRFLESYVVQSRPGWGSWSADWVPEHALCPRCAGCTDRAEEWDVITAANATPDLLAPELHVIAVSETVATDDTAPAIVHNVVITRRGSRNPTDAVGPIRTVELSKQYRDLYGVAIQEPGIVAIFPLSAVTAANEILVSFDRTARGATAISACKDCTVPFAIARLR